MSTFNEFIAGFYWILAGAVAYYVLAWLMLIAVRKRDEETVVVHYQPPDRLSPAAIRYIYTMQCDGRSLCLAESVSQARS